MEFFEALEAALKRFVSDDDPDWDLRVLGFLLTHVCRREIQECIGEDDLLDYIHDHQQGEHHEQIKRICNAGGASARVAL